MKIWNIFSAIFFLLATSFLGTVASASEEIDSIPHGDRITLDGDASDWEGVPVRYLEGSLHVVAITHDDDDLYVMYRFADESLARRLFMRGVTLWINGDGKTNKKKEVFAVRYQGSEQLAEKFNDEGARGERLRAGSEGSETFGRGGPPPPLASMRPAPGRLTVIRMGVKESIDEQSSVGPAAASAFGEGRFCYELKIPFVDIGGKIANANPAKDRRVAIGIQIGGMTEAEMELMQATMVEKVGAMGGGPPRAGGMEGGPPGGRGMGGGPAAGGGMGRPGADRRDRMNADIEWLSVTLKPTN